jgi:hypothetical protein
LGLRNQFKIAALNFAQLAFSQFKLLVHVSICGANIVYDLLVLLYLVCCYLTLQLVVLKLFL